jgi:hypothetical protein
MREDKQRKQRITTRNPKKNFDEKMRTRKYFATDRSKMGNKSFVGLAAIDK